MGNGTSFVFVTGGVERAYEMALQAAAGKDVRIGGGAQIPVTPKVGEKLFSNENLQL